ncbi:hypothetical protein LCGC14_1483340, partial [marine sediment metagenome]
MTRRIGWLLAVIALTPLACAPRSARRGGEGESKDDRAARVAKLKAYYGDTPQAVEEMLPRIRAHVEALAAMGPRQTGQEGCKRALEYVRAELVKAAGEKVPVTDLPNPPPVTVPLDRLSSDKLDSIGDADGEFTHIVVEGLGDRKQSWPAYALMPNSVQSCSTVPPEPPKPPGQSPDEDAQDAPAPMSLEQARRVVDIGAGTWQDLEGKELSGAVVLLDFNSMDAWLRAASLGATGAIFIEPTRTTVFQADKKYLATLPLHFPRVYLKRDHGLELRRALAADAQGKIRVTLRCRLEFQNVPAEGLELTIPGKDRSYCFVLAGHLDARSIVPDLSYGGAELWGIAELIELTRYFLTHQPNCDIRVIFVTGHWQSQRVMRDYIARGGPVHDLIRNYFKLAMAVDMVPEGRSLNLITEGPWDIQSRGMYKWLGNRLFTEGGWRDQIFDGLEVPKGEVQLLGGIRPWLSETRDGNMANRNDRSAFAFAPRYPTAEQAWQSAALPTFAFQTSRLTRLAHNTPLDRLDVADADSVDRQLRPQLRMTVRVLRHLLD